MKKITLITLLIFGNLFSNKIIAQTNDASKVHLTMLYEHYINLKTAFIKSDVKSVIAMAKEVQRELPNAEKAFDKLSDNKVWNTRLVKMKNSLNSILKSEDIEKQRENFATLSEHKGLWCYRNACLLSVLPNGT